MNKFTILIIPVLLIMLMSCSPDESESPEVSYIDIVINESPWVFHHAESQLISSSGYELTDSEIEEIEKKENRDYENSYQGSILMFNRDGRGTYDSPRENQAYDFAWNSIEKDEIRWALRALYYFCYLKNTEMGPELSWEWSSVGYYVRNGQYIKYTHEVSLVFR